MEYRVLGRSGLRVPVLGFGTATFGGRGPLFGNMGTTSVDEACRMVDICLDAGVNLFDSADIYSNGAAEEVLGAAIKGRRDRVIISTKMTLPVGRGPNDAGSGRCRLVTAVDNALERLGTDYLDILYLHCFDSFTPIEEVLSTFDALVRAGKLRYVGVSNFSGWQLMKSLAVADRFGWPRYVAHQVYYSLLGRDYEWELMPLGLDQHVGAVAWSPLGWGRLTGKIRQGEPPPAVSRLHVTAKWGPPVANELFYQVVEALDGVAVETGKTVPQIAIAWVLSRPTVSAVLIGARDETQLRDNLGAAGWKLTAEQIRRLDEASVRPPPYPYSAYYSERSYAALNPPPV
jgi:aryl-alcohol dehydrogenase-like predicted oxidoreductase